MRAFACHAAVHTCSRAHPCGHLLVLFYAFTRTAARTHEAISALTHLNAAAHAHSRLHVSAQVYAQPHTCTFTRNCKCKCRQRRPYASARRRHTDRYGLLPTNPLLSFIPRRFSIMPWLPLTREKAKWHLFQNLTYSCASITKPPFYTPSPFRVSIPSLLSPIFFLPISHVQCPLLILCRFTYYFFCSSFTF